MGVIRGARNYVESARSMDSERVISSRAAACLPRDGQYTDYDDPAEYGDVTSVQATAVYDVTAVYNVTLRMFE